MRSTMRERPNLQLSDPAFGAPSMTKRLLVVLIGTTVVFGAIFGMKYLGRKGMNAHFDNMPVPPATITSAVAEAMTWENRLEAAGTLVAVQGTEVTTPAGGIVEAIHFESGRTVKEGARLVTLDSANEVGELKRLKAQAELAELNRVRGERLVEQAAISKSEYDGLVAAAHVAAAAVEAQQGKVAQKEIRAPFGGLLGIRRINLGQYVAPGTPIVTLQSLDPIDVDFALPEHHFAAVRQGQTINVAVDSYPGEAFAGRVLAVEPRVTESTRNFGVRARLPNRDHRLRAGMFAHVTLQLPGRADVVAVPRTAINYDPYGNSVFVIQKKEAPPAAAGQDAAAPAKGPAVAGGPPKTDLVVRQRFVRTGDARGDFVVVLEGLQPGEQVATSGLLKLRNDQPVIINNDVRPDATLNPTPEKG